MHEHHHHHSSDTHTELKGRLKELSLRATRPRLAVLTVLHDRGAPATHEEVMAGLHSSDAALDRATVYRILSDLSDADLLRRMDLGDKIWRYELQDHCRAIAPDHAHFLCDDCGTVSCLPPLQLRTVSGGLPEALRGAELRLRVSGRCAGCVAAG